MFNMWRAFCTIHWFATGHSIISDSQIYVTDEMYEWFINIENRIEDRRNAAFDRNLALFAEARKLKAELRAEKPDALVMCRICGDELRGHDDDGADICRWCDQGWKPEIRRR